MAVEIRKMRMEDYQKALSLWRELPGIGLSGADEEEEIRKFLAKNPQTNYIALVDGELAGTILGGSDGRRGYIYHLAVAPRHQKKGIGSRLVQTCLAAFKSLGIQKSHIFLIRDNVEGLKFWERIGWAFRKDIRVMSKEL